MQPTPNGFLIIRSQRTHTLIPAALNSRNTSIINTRLICSKSNCPRVRTISKPVCFLMHFSRIVSCNITVLCGLWQSRIPNKLSLSFTLSGDISHKFQTKTFFRVVRRLTPVINEVPHRSSKGQTYLLTRGHFRSRRCTCAPLLACRRRSEA